MATHEIEQVPLGEEAPVTRARVGVVCIGSSAGGISALPAVINALPGNFAVPVVVVQHLDPHHISRLDEVLSRGSQLRVTQPRHGETLRAGIVYLAPPNMHLVIVEGARVALSDAKPVHFHRPSIDTLLESAAKIFGASVVAVILTGSGSDGAAGVKSVHAAGGRVLVQEPTTAAYPSMPKAAVATGFVDEILPLDAIGPALARLVEDAAAR